MAAARQERDRGIDLLRLPLINLVRLSNLAARQEGGTGLRLSVRALYWTAGGFLDQASEVLTRATSSRAILLRYGMPPGLLEELREDVTRSQAAQDRATKAAELSVDAGLELVALGQLAAKTVRHLDALNRIRFAFDHDVLSEWEAARSMSWRDADTTSVA